jgi:hypothetical protein
MIKASATNRMSAVPTTRPTLPIFTALVQLMPGITTRAGSRVELVLIPAARRTTLAGKWRLWRSMVPPISLRRGSMEVGGE